jgi:hypothetical protein
VNDLEKNNGMVELVSRGNFVLLQAICSR